MIYIHEYHVYVYMYIYIYTHTYTCMLTDVSTIIDAVISCRAGDPKRPPEGAAVALGTEAPAEALRLSSSFTS